MCRPHAQLQQLAVQQERQPRQELPQRPESGACLQDRAEQLGVQVEQRG